MIKAIINLLIYLLFPSIFLAICNASTDSASFPYLYFVIHIIMIIYFVLTNKKELISSIKKINFKDFKKVLIIFIIGFILLIASNYLLNYIVMPNGISDNEKMVRTLINSNKILLPIIICILTPFIEEIVFRFGFRKKIKNDMVFLLVTSALFSILHIITATTLTELLYFIPYFIFGYTLGLIYIKTDNIYYSFIFHALNNIVTAVVVLLF